MADNIPFFIVGCGRSGNTLMRLILTAHSRIFIPSETHWIRTLIRELPLTATLTPSQAARAVEIMVRDDRWGEMDMPAQDLQRQANSLTQPKLVDLLNLVYRHHLLKSTKQRPGDKTPDHIQIIPQLLQMFPAAKFIHMIRDGRDVAISHIDVGWGRYNDREIFEWTDVMRRRREYLASAQADQVLEVRYERLLQDLEGEIKRVCAFLGEEYESGMLDWHKNLYLIPKERLSDIHRKLANSLRSDNVSLWRSKLSAMECFVMEAFLWKDLQGLGYPLRFAKIGWRPALAVTRWVFWLLAPLLKRGVPYLERRRYLPRKVYI